MQSQINVPCLERLSVNIVKRLVARLAENFAAAALLLWCTTAAGQEAVHFPSLEDNGPGRSATPLDGYLFRPVGERKHPPWFSCTGAAVSSTARHLCSRYAG